MNRGDIYWADLVARSGSEQTGRRPVVVISSDGFNDSPTWRSVMVVPMTTSPSQAKCGPTVVELKDAGTVLLKRSFAVCHQVTTLDRAKLTKRFGALSSAELRDVQNGLKAAMDLD